jgi:hypothetical protein
VRRPIGKKIMKGGKGIFWLKGFVISNEGRVLYLVLISDA